MNDAVTQGEEPQRALAPLDIQTKRRAVTEYFEGQNAGDAQRVVGLFTRDAVVYNVNLPVVRGEDDIRRFCLDLYARTAARRFEVIRTATGSDVVMAEWEALLTFAADATVAGHVLTDSFDVILRGVNCFVFESAGKITELRVFHETTTVAQMAAENAS